MAYLVYPASNALAAFGPITVTAKDFDHVMYFNEDGCVEESGFEFYKDKQRTNIVAYFAGRSISGFVRVDD